ncbi:P-loop containing nucleoside triphosphate hydrolase protein [Trametopsis cervina]|nr:P-loop containing nucleoside triphosphate hydrolase protein [Trametopsis cervina]
MRLRSIKPPLPEALLVALEGCDIRTDADLMLRQSIALDIWKKIPPGVLSMSEVESYVRDIISRTSTSVLCGKDLAWLEAQQDAARAKLATGVPQLDEIINGVNGPKVLEISGDHGSGKTALALNIVARHLIAYPDYAALWIDTTGDFSPDRMQQIIGQCCAPTDANSVAERVQLSLAFDFSAAEKAMMLLYTNPKIRCIVIDSITPIIRPLLNAASSGGHILIASFMQQLRFTAEAHALTVLVLNSTSSATPLDSYSTSLMGFVRKPALGPSFAYMSDATLWLERQLPPSVEHDEDHPMEDGDVETDFVYTVDVLRSKYTPSKTRRSFKIKDGLLKSA